MANYRDPESSGRHKRPGSSSYGETQWTSWLVPLIVVVNVAMFIVIMYQNDCPNKNSGVRGDCVAKFLKRFSFQPLKENPLFGPSSSAYVYFHAHIFILLISILRFLM